MSQAVPIRPNVTFSCDTEREIIDYLICRVKHHIADYGEAPDTIAIVTEGPSGRTPHSFSLNPNQDRAATCGAAAALLLKRAAEE